MKSLAVVALLLLLTGCVVPQTFSKLTIRGQVTDTETKKGIPNVGIGLKFDGPVGWGDGQSKPVGYGPFYTDENGKFLIEFSPPTKLRPLVGRYSPYPTLLFVADGYAGGQFVPWDDYGKKDPFSEPVVVKLSRQKL
jgi:hypothetical protein